jgi:thiol-disulfide isomerase/thioredoxin
MILRPLVAFVAAISFVAPATAQPVKPFTLAALKAAQAKGQSVLVDVFAPWCPTCRAQAPTIAAISTDPAFAKLLILRVDYDHQTAEKTALGVNKQATLIAYHGGRETGRVLGVTDPAQLKALAASAFR